MAAVRGRPEALLMVEFSSATTRPRCRTASTNSSAGSDRRAGLIAAVPALDPATRDPLWDLRRAAVPLLYGMPGDRKPVTFVEDCAVAPERLPEFAARFREIFHRHGTDGAFYGHASVGCLHIRPVLNLNDPTDVVTMRRIMEEVTDLVLAFNGSLSGEHGDGLVRSEWNRKMFGPVVYEAFRQVKRGFDPENLLNPGKVVDAPAMTENLRVPPGHAPPEPPTVFDYSKQGGLLPLRRAVQRRRASAARRRAGRCARRTARRATRRTRRAAGRTRCVALVASTGQRRPGTTGRRLRLARPGRALDRRGHGPVPDVQGVQEPSARATWTWRS